MKLAKRLAAARAMGWAMSCALAATVLAGSGARAQEAEKIVSPEVMKGQVTFRFRAPNAKEVSVVMEGYAEPLEMTKDESGVWSVTTETMAPDYYGYSIGMAGQKLVDPGNSLLVPNLLGAGSAVHVPGPALLPWEENEAPHGEIHRHFYHSNVVGDDRDFYVYTPANYDPRGKRKYPVLYLLHGYSDDASAWVAVGHANVILDNLIAEGKARPMIVVMPLGYGAPEILAKGWNGPRDKTLWEENIEKFGETLLEEVMPRVESEYRVETGRDSRAIAGLSMGGAETLLVGLNHLDKFAYLGAFSSGGVGKDFAKDFPNLDAGGARKPRVFWMSCGSDDGLLAPNEKLHEWLEGKGVQVEWVESPGAHWWPVWRRNLADLLPQLFQPERASDYWTQQVQRQRP
ncbi:MAG TPA: alpha/beta hydrolase-fold protein [Verrucomicrobiae bacterium]|nr:alpha/beta hydrolase-fold protein [Verrucomicrobiae bacterium]